MDPIQIYAEDADVVNVIRERISQKKYFGYIIFSGNCTGLPGNNTRGLVQYVRPNGTLIVHLNFVRDNEIYYGNFNASETTPNWVKYALKSDLYAINKYPRNGVITITFPGDYEPVRATILTIMNDAAGDSFIGCISLKGGNASINKIFGSSAVPTVSYDNRVITLSNIGNYANVTIVPSCAVIG